MWFGPVAVEIWPFQISNTIAIVLHLLLAQVEFHSNCMIFGYIWSYKQRYICKYHVWVWNNSHTSLFPTIPPWDPFLLLRETPSSLCLMQDNLLTLLLLPLACMCSLYPDFAPRSVQSFKRLLEVIPPGFPLPTYTMPFILSHLERQRMLSRWPRHLPMLSTNPSLLSQCASTWRRLVWRL